MLNYFFLLVTFVTNKAHDSKPSYHKEIVKAHEKIVSLLIADDDSELKLFKKEFVQNLEQTKSIISVVDKTASNSHL